MSDQIRSPRETQDWEDLIIQALEQEDAGIIDGFDRLLTKIRTILTVNGIIMPGDFLENNIRQAFCRLQGKNRISYGQEGTDLIILFPERTEDLS